MDEYLQQIIAAALHSPIIGIGTWLKWQSMKTGTIVPTGAWTEKNGRISGWAIHLFTYMNFLFVFSDPFGWHLILVLLLIWFLGGWTATLIERKLYGTEERLETIVYAVESYGKSLRPEQLREFIDGLVPQWWIRLMPMSWRGRVTKRINESIQDDAL